MWVRSAPEFSSSVQEAAGSARLDSKLEGDAPMNKWLLGLTGLFLVGCVASADGQESDEPSGEPVAEVTSELKKGQIAAMNHAAEGTSIYYALIPPRAPGLPETLALNFGPNGNLRRTSRYHLDDNTHVADV